MSHVCGKNTKGNLEKKVEELPFTELKESSHSVPVNNRFLE
jgi:hypothetical protein